jgi:competence protein ComEA
VGRPEALRRWSDSLADRLGVTPWGLLAGVAAVAAAALGGWWALSSPAPPPAESVLPRVDVASVAPVPESEPPEAPIGVIVVHVDGAVAFPGVHELEAGARVVDAIEAAEGLLPQADRSRLNLAASLTDGQRLWVPVVGEEEPEVVGITGGATADSEGSSAGPVNLNTADLAELETLPGIGPSIAGAIIRYREENGSFARVEDLLDVPGIGPTRLEQLESLVAV